MFLQMRVADSLKSVSKVSSPDPVIREYSFCLDNDHAMTKLRTGIVLLHGYRFFKPGLFVFFKPSKTLINTAGMNGLPPIDIATLSQKQSKVKL